MSSDFVIFTKVHFGSKSKVLCSGSVVASYPASPVGGGEPGYKRPVHGIVLLFTTHLSSLHTPLHTYHTSHTPHTFHIPHTSPTPTHLALLTHFLLLTSHNPHISHMAPHSFACTGTTYKLLPSLKKTKSRKRKDETSTPSEPLAQFLLRSCELNCKVHFRIAYTSCAVTPLSECLEI